MRKEQSEENTDISRGEHQKSKSMEKKGMIFQLFKL